MKSLVMVTLMGLAATTTMQTQGVSLRAHIQSQLMNTQAEEVVTKVLGICYGPDGNIPAGAQRWDDVMTSGGQVFWGDSDGNRGDLATIAAMGAKSVRLYGLAAPTSQPQSGDTEFDHTAFLNAATSHGISVVPGTSDYPYIQASPNCASNGFNCYSVMLPWFNGLLQYTGFASNGAWSSAIPMYILINEPDLKLHPGNTGPSWKTMTLGILTALDALLVAEQQSGITGYKPKLTVPFSTAQNYDSQSYCLTNGILGGLSDAVLQMCDMYEVIKNPSLVGYTPQSSQAALDDVLANRMVYSFNTNMLVSQIQSEIITPYKTLPFGTKELYITEFHNPTDNEAQVLASLQGAAALPEISGIYFFQYQVSEKGGQENDYGAFNYGPNTIGNCVWPNCNSPTPVSCLTTSSALGYNLGQAVATAFGGQAPTSTSKGFC